MDPITPTTLALLTNAIGKHFVLLSCVVTTNVSPTKFEITYSVPLSQQLDWTKCAPLKTNAVAWETNQIATLEFAGLGDGVTNKSVRIVVDMPIKKSWDTTPFKTTQNNSRNEYTNAFGTVVTLIPAGYWYWTSTP